jgi:hypothetical protein
MAIAEYDMGRSMAGAAEWMAHRLDTERQASWDDRDGVFNLAAIVFKNLHNESQRSRVIETRRNPFWYSPHTQTQGNVRG